MNNSRDVSFIENYTCFIKEVDNSKFLISPFIQDDILTKNRLKEYFSHLINLENLNSSELYRVTQVQYWKGKLILNREQ